MLVPDLNEMADLGSEAAQMGILDFLKRFGGGLIKGVVNTAKNIFGFNPAQAARGLVNKAESAGYLSDMSYMDPLPLPVMIETIYGIREIHEVDDPAIIAPGERVAPDNMNQIKEQHLAKMQQMQNGGQGVMA